MSLSSEPRGCAASRWARAAAAAAARSALLATDGDGADGFLNQCRSPRAVDPVRVLAADNSAWSESPLMREPRSDPAAANLPAGSKMPVAGGQPCQLGK